jgi:hypothetical protein
LRFTFRAYRSPSPIPSLAGSTIRYKPVIPMTIIGPGSQETSFVLIDPGSDDIVFPAALAQRIGVDLAQAPQRHSQGVGATQAVPVLYAPVILVVSDSVQTVRWRGIVGFVSVPLRFPLFGIAGGLQFFRTTLDGVRELELVPDPSLPVTQDAVP